MKKTRTNSIIFVIISTLLLFIAVGSAFFSAILIFNANKVVGTIIALGTLALAFIGGNLLRVVHNYIFDHITSRCDECYSYYDTPKRKVNTNEHGKVYITNHCPNCNTNT